MKAKKQILIIDDEPVFIEIIKFSLVKAGFSVISALDGEEGIKKAHLLPDLILLDIIMPGMDGYEVCRRLKKDDITKFIPIIMLTAKDGTLEKVKAFDLGVVDYMGKHFPPLEMIARIKAVLRQSSLATGPGLEKQKNKKITQLRKIIDEKNLRITFQPIVVLSNKNPMGYEALMRGPEGGDFEDPLVLSRWASEANRFFEIDDIYRNLALKNAGFLTQKHLLFLSADPIIAETEPFKSLNFLKQASIKPSQICLELSERGCIGNSVKFSQASSYFKSAGFKLAIDDVGEGYASLETIAELSPDFIKLGSFLAREVNLDAEKQKLIQAIVDLAKKINSYIIAKGIETKEECGSLVTLGVNYGQGALFGESIKSQ